MQFFHGAFYPYQENGRIDNRIPGVLNVPLNPWNDNDKTVRNRDRSFAWLMKWLGKLFGVGRLNEQYGDAEYLAIMRILVIAMVHEFQPNIIFVSSGFDSGEGDPYGDMRVTKAGYYYMAGLLAEMGIPLVVVQEGGYNFDSMARGAEGVMNGLIAQVGGGWLEHTQTLRHASTALMYSWDCFHYYWIEKYMNRGR